MRVRAWFEVASLLLTPVLGCGSNTADSHGSRAHDAGARDGIGDDGGAATRAHADAGHHVTTGTDAGSGATNTNHADAGSSSARDAGTATRDAALDANAFDGSSDAGAIAADHDAALPEPEALPICAAPTVDFDTAPLATGGEIAIGLSSWLIPAGVNERAYVDVLAAGDPDPAFAGPIVWTLPAGVEVVTATPAAAGQAEVTFRFAHAGTFRLEAHLDGGDLRTGFAEVMVYASQLPIWEVNVELAAYERILTDIESREEIPGTLRIDGQDHPTTMRLHGGSSRHFPKKSFRFELQDTGKASGTYGKKLIVRAEYNDKTLLRNWLALRMFAQATRIPTARSQLVHLRVNDRYYGVMLNVERVDSRLLDRWSLPRTGSMYEGDPIDALSSPGANLTPLAPEQYPDVYPLQNGSLAYADLRKFIEETLLLPDEEFGNTIEHELEVDKYIDYLAMMAAIQNQDDVRKNYYLYRDPAGSIGWQILPWDLDLSFGHLWSEENETLEEEIVADSDIFVGVKVPERGGFYNQLIDRMLTRPAYRARFRARVEQLLTNSVNRESAESMLSSAIRCATPDLVADTQKRASNAEYLERVAEIGAYLDARKAYVKALP